MYYENLKARDEGGLISSDVSARSELIELILSGKIRSFHRNRIGLARPLRQEDRSEDGPVTLQLESDNSLINDYRKLINSRSMFISQITIEVPAGPELGEVIIQNKDIISAITSRPEIENCNRSRPKDYDRELFLMKAFEVLWFPPCVVPESKETHIERTIELHALVNNGAAPSKSWSRPIISKLWETLGLKGGDAPPENKALV
jgi:hypothetical protein